MVYMSSKSNVEYNSKIDKGDQYMRALEYDKAEASYLAAIEIEPKEEEAYLKVADLYIDQEQYEETENILLRGQEKTNAALVTKKLGQILSCHWYGGPVSIRWILDDEDISNRKGYNASL